MWYMHDIGWGWWLLMSVGMVAFWALVIWGIVTFARGGSSNPQPLQKDPDRPLEILQRRLARGEISVEQYQKLRDALIGERERTPA
jgi:putative membrane protein